MPSEMLSGPDLGAGYLHQLTTDREGEHTTFTFHAQDGGQDANGPPKGSLDAFGFVHPPSSCPFGGPRCWHRRFLLPFSETARVRPCYNRNRFVLQAMIDQVYAGAPIAIESALGELLGRIDPLPELKNGAWMVGGSTAAWLLGAPVQPQDIDLYVPREGIDAVGRALNEYLIEPVATTDWPPLGIVRGGRAFVGTFVAGARVEWATPLEATSALDAWGATSDGPRTVLASFRERSLRVPRPEYTLVRAAGKGRTATVGPLAAWLRRYGADAELLEALLARYRLPAPAAAAVRAALEA
jgi:hypothetical protein